MIKENDPLMAARDISWLSFNERVLQEAEDENVPLIERMRFLGIFSNNRDEFFRVRVATLRRLAEMGKKALVLFDENESPKDVIPEIQKIVLNQVQRFNKIYDSLLNELRKEHIYMINETQLSTEQAKEVMQYFKAKVRPALVPVMLNKKTPEPHLKDKAIYLGIRASNRKSQGKMKYALIEIPTGTVDRFYILNSGNEKERYIILLDDIIRLGLKDVFRIFDFHQIEAYNFKMTRDAELDIDNDISASWMEKMVKSLDDRKKGEPVRFVYDREMPEDLLGVLMKKLRLHDVENIIPAGRYHNFKDFMGFPSIGRKELRYESLPPQDHPGLKDQRSYLEVISNKDILLSYPYQHFSYIINLLREAAIDPKVESIQINLYRVAKNSMVINALINAAQNGKNVTVVVELQARFDEENNIRVSNRLEDAGVRIIFGVPGLKVHSKLILITRKEGRSLKHYAHIGTGNFHEGTARIYGDYSLLTANQEIAREVVKVFEFFERNYRRPAFKHLIVSPFNMRRRFIQMINQEIDNAEKGKEAYIILKLNNLVDHQMVRKLYEASQAGVKVRLMNRGICSLVPGVKGLSENIEVYSVVDRFLEHARVEIFCNGGDEMIYIGSADWMTRNIDYRVELTTPVYDPEVRKTIRDMIDIQFQDNTKCRIIDKKQTNPYRKPEKGEQEVRSQIAQYEYFKRMNQ